MAPHFLRLQKRLAASILKCGKHRVWLDPNDSAEHSMANSRHVIRHLIRNGIIVKKAVSMHSRYRKRLYREAKIKGRHTGLGKRKGTSDARMPQKTLWIRRQRVLRRLLRNYRDNKKIDKHMYHLLYKCAKGNQFKNKRVLIEVIHSKKAAKQREKALQDQIEVQKAKALQLREKKKQKKKVKEEGVRRLAASQ
ncbi:ribosomal protein RPL19 [Cardiosporidium cionae]|uniref:Ribosomal protein L19 n=1 Tax=Cardiosporidium cionae TaxID=476202 RepID=A0ABQ7J798_9APIC|nr:ribosomal protein RPL19 [Cardiosporidium cionae]|eukprot:KAF8819863.1 ribosomal protein RPL19 [Cardiosporidium cionae]